MKKLVLLVLAVMMCLAIFAGCGAEAPAEGNGGEAPAEATGEIYDAGEVSALVPDGWKAFPVPDIFAEEENATDPSALQICKGGTTEFDLFTKPYIQINYYGPDKVVDGVNKYITFSSAKVGKAVPAKPKNFKASCYNATTVKLSWSEVAGAYGYRVYQSTSGKAGTFYKLYETDDPNKTNVTVYNRTTGKTYYYKVRAISEYSGSEVSGTLTSAVSVKVLPTKPTITLTKPASRSVKISWNAIYKASGYEVYRSLSGRDGTFYLNKRITSGTTTSHTNTGMTKGETYYYKVRTYRTVEGKRIYSAFSAVKKITL